MSTGKSQRRLLIHAYRVGIFVLLMVLIRQHHSWYVAQRAGAMKQPLTVREVLPFFPEADRLSDWDPGHGGQNVLGGDGKPLGHVIQTSPDSDDIYGFSGPTNSMIALDREKKILGVKVLRSDDTREHLAQVRKDRAFFDQWRGMTEDEVLRMEDLDTVSGATLTSQAIGDGISRRFGGGAKASRFPGEISIEEVKTFLAGATSLADVPKKPYLKKVLDGRGEVAGFVSRSSPHADQMIGYQGPTDVLIVLDREERVTGLAIRKTFDNEPYVRLIREDEYFFNSFKGFELGEIARIDVVESGFDVVSGATKTSVTLAEGLVHSAGEIARVREPLPPKPLIDLRVRDVGTMLVVILGLVIALTRLRGNRRLRVAFQALLIGYLGFVNADMLSQALLAGWARSGIAWKVAPGLVFLSAAALIAPVVTGRQVYCTHLCPYGAVQDWLGRRLPWQVGIRGRWEKILSALPVVLLGWCLVVAMGHLPFSLVSLEPFDAFVFRIAGWASITVAVAGLIASPFLNRAYCRYGCPTGAMLKFLRFRGAAGDRWERRDAVAAGFLLIAVGIMLLR